MTTYTQTEKILDIALNYSFISLEAGRSIIRNDMYRRFIEVGFRIKPFSDAIIGFGYSFNWLGQTKPHSHCLNLKNINYFSVPPSFGCYIEYLSRAINMSLNFHIEDLKFSFAEIEDSDKKSLLQPFISEEICLWQRFSHLNALVGFFHRPMTNCTLEKSLFSSKYLPFTYDKLNANWGGIVELKYSISPHIHVSGKCTWDNYNSYRFGASIELDSSPVQSWVTRESKRYLLPLQYDIKSTDFSFTPNAETQIAM